MAQRQLSGLYPWAVAAIVTSGFFLRLLFFTGPTGTDDLRYVEYAKSLAALQPISAVDHAAARSVFLLYLSVPLSLGGHASFAALANVVMSVATVVTTTAFAWHRLGRGSALVVAAMLATHPISIAYSSAILPDTVLTFALAVALVLVLLAESPQVEARGAYYFMAGLLVGLGYASKETALLVLPPIAVYLLLFGSRPPKTRVVYLGMGAAGFLVVVFLDGLFYSLVADDFFYRATAIRTRHNQRIVASAGFVEHFQRGWASVELTIRDWRWTWSTILLGVPAFATVAAIKPKYRLLGLCGLFVLLFLLFGTSSLSRLVPLPFKPRYFQALAPVVALSVGALVPRSVPGLGGALVPWGLAAGLAGAQLGAGLPEVGRLAGRMYAADYCRHVQLAMEILQDERRPMYSDPRTVACFPSFDFIDRPFRVETLPENGPLPTGFFVLNPVASRRQGLSSARQREVQALPVRLRLGLDLRRPDLIPVLTKYSRPEPILVYENASSEGELEHERSPP